MNDTPRTNAIEDRCFEQRTDVREVFVHARQLERELVEARSQRDKALVILRYYRHEIPLEHQPYMLGHEVDLLLKECGE